MIAPLLLALVAGQTPSPQCLSAHGETACGYDCLSSYGQLKCAQTPSGICRAAYGEVVCWDPPSDCEEESAPPAECLSNYGKTACGWGCLASHGEVRCSQVPGGICVAQFGTITCVEPPRHHHRKHR
jgi:hypothetical protein